MYWDWFDWSIILVFLTDTKYPLTNVASTLHGGTCSSASTNNESCSLMIDGSLNADSLWKSTGTNQGKGSWVEITLNAKYRLLGGRIMQKFNKTGQSKTLQLQFSDDSSQSVSNS